MSTKLDLLKVMEADEDEDAFRMAPPSIPHLPVNTPARSLAGKPLAGFCATRSRRIQDLYGMVVHVIRCNTHYAIDNRR